MQHAARHGSPDFQEKTGIDGAEVGTAAVDDEQAAGHGAALALEIAVVAQGHHVAGAERTAAAAGFIGAADKIAAGVGIDGIAVLEVADSESCAGERAAGREIAREDAGALEDGEAVDDEGAGRGEKAVGFDDGAGDRLGDLERAGHRVAGGVDVAVVEGSAEGAG